MQAHSKSEPVAWPLRIFSPWLVATLGGLFIGTALLNMDRDDFSARYQDSSNRAATFESPLPTSAHKSGNDLEISAEEPFEPDTNAVSPDTKFDASVSFETPPPRIEASADTAASSVTAVR